MDLQGVYDQLLATLGGGLLNFLAALGFLIGGWIIALIAAAVTRTALRRTNIDERVGRAISGEGGASPLDLEKWIPRLVFYVILLFGIVGFFNKLNLPAVSGPLQTLLNQISLFLPRLFGALGILLVAWIIASLVKLLITQLADRTRLDERLAQQADLGDGEGVSLSKSLATAAYWIIFLLFLPALLNQLGVEGLVAPVQGMVGSILASIPNAFSAGLILLVGWFIARIVRQIVVNLLKVAGADRVGERVGLRADQSLSGLAGTIVYALIMVSVIITALGELNVEAISGPATAMLTTVLEVVPAIFGAALILVLAYLVARLLAGLVTSLLSGIGFDSLPEKMGLRADAFVGQRTPSEIVGFLVIVAAMLFAATEAASLLGFTRLSEMISNFTSFGGQVLLALVLFGIGFYLANLARNLILSAGGEQSMFTANLARVAILVFVTAMALRQMGIADEIVNLAFAILLGAIGIAVALAFGLGSREIAAGEVSRWLHSMRGTTANAPQAAAPSMAVAPQAAAPQVATSQRSETDDLTKIEGIGPKISGLLQAAGIQTFAQLASTDVARLQSILDAAGPRYRIANPSSWPAQARLAASGDWEALQKLQDSLVGGR